MRWLLSLIFIVQMYLVMALMAVAFALPALVDRRAAFAAVHLYCALVRLTLRLLCGLRTEIRGQVPEGAVLVAAKHQSFLDIILLAAALPRPKFIMKRELMWAPFLGLYALRIGCIPVNRGKRGQAMAKMRQDVLSSPVQGQLIIYPQGTRVAPGVEMPYKIGAGVLYDNLGQVCVPVATNVGLFWPRHGILRKPGLAVVEFLDPIAPGLKVQEVMRLLESRIEPASVALMQEAGWRA